MTEPSLIVVAGPTASGKTAVSIQIAKEIGGEIISADSRAIYKGADIGTAKPTVEERQSVAHWGFDLVEPGERFSAAEFQHYAVEKIAQIRKRGNVPMIVGGTGLYIDSVIYDFVFPKIDKKWRDELMSWTLDKLHEYCLDNNIVLPQNHQNKLHVVNNILRFDQPSKRKLSILPNTIAVVITTKKETLNDKIKQRAAKMFESGVIEEGAKLADKYGWDKVESMGNIYPILRKLGDRTLKTEQAIDLFVRADQQLAKRQATWFRRHPEIEQLPLDEVYTYIMSKLADRTTS